MALCPHPRRCILRYRAQEGQAGAQVPETQDGPRGWPAAWRDLLCRYGQCPSTHLLRAGPTPIADNAGAREVGGQLTRPGCLLSKGAGRRRKYPKGADAEQLKALGLVIGFTEVSQALNLRSNHACGPALTRAPLQLRVPGRDAGCSLLHRRRRHAAQCFSRWCQTLWSTQAEQRGRTGGGLVAPALRWWFRACPLKS